MEITKKPFQEQELEQLVPLDNCANWDEMGCFKTSTVLWWLEEKFKHKAYEVDSDGVAEQTVVSEKAPKVLVITTRSGKGTYWLLTPQVHPNWELFNIQRKKVTLVIDDMELPVDEIPLNGNHPMLFVAHYDVFTERKPRKKAIDKAAKKEVTEESNPLLEQMIQLHGKQDQGLVDELLKIEWDAVVIDEAHRIKGRKTGWTKNIKKLKTKRKQVMTGTGFINRPDEIWSLLHFLEPRRFTSYWRFRERYCDEEVDWSGFRKIKGIKPDTEQEFKELIRSFGPRHTKRDVFPNLPEPIFSPIEVELNATQLSMYEAIRDELYALDQQGLPILAPNVLSALQRLRQICVATPEVVRDYYDPEEGRRRQEIKLVEPSSKLDALMEIVEGLEWDDERRDQVVVFSNFKDPIELAKARFDKAGISYIHMQQSDNDRKRYEKWSIEFPKREKQVFICTLQLGSESISLTSATTCVFLDRSWSPKDNEQGISRVWRPGQEYPANIIHINAKDTVDERVFRVNEIKKSWFTQIFG